MSVRRLLSVALSSVALVGLLTGPVTAAETPAASSPSTPLVLAADSAEGRLQAALASAAVAQTGKAYAGEADDIEAMKAFYTARQFAPVWTSGKALTARAVLVAQELSRADDWGLKAADFAVPALDGSIDPTAAELLMMRAVLKYARYARGGRIADPGNDLSGFIDRKPQIVAPGTMLEQLAQSATPDTTLRNFNPQHAGFERLRQAYLSARATEGQSASLMMPSGPMLVPGASHPNVALLRRRLGIAAPVATPKNTTPELTYDDALVAAVKEFQKSNGLRPDSYVGERTRLALNGDGDSKSTGASLLANMEQWRWMPEKLGSTYVQVNIPEYEMRVVRDTEVIHSERVVTGKLETATPMFSANMQTIVFQPKWGVPDSIKVNELLPRLQDGRGLRSGLKMTLNGRDVDPWDVDWSRADITRYHIYQPSGDDNALGVVKFLFPNKHAVYLHDTPSKGLFNTQRRSYSHGCVRVRNPVKLAEVLLAADKSWSAARVRKLVDDGPEDNPVRLDTTLPVHITYFTASVDSNGKLSTYPDVYGHEKRITLALEGRADQIAKLNPAPVAVFTPPANDAPDKARGKRRRNAEAASNEDGNIPGVDPALAPPSGLGGPKAVRYVATPVPEPKVFKSKGSRFGGNTTNDVIMRALGGF